MEFGLEKQLFLAAVVLYGVSFLFSIFLLRTGFRRDNRLNYALLLAAFFAHTASMLHRGYTEGRCPVNNLYEAVVFLGWTMNACYLVLGVWHRLRFLGAFASPILFAIGIFALMPSLDPPVESGTRYIGGLASLHASLILLAYGAFGLSSIAGLMYLTQEHELKFHKVRAVISLMPPIQRMERVASRLLAAGFVLLTTGLILSPFLMKREFGIYFSGDPKIVWSALVWSLYLALLVGHWFFAQQGRRFAWGTVGSFAFVILTFWGINLLSPVHNP